MSSVPHIEKLSSNSYGEHVFGDILVKFSISFAACPTIELQDGKSIWWSMIRDAALNLLIRRDIREMRSRCGTLESPHEDHETNCGDSLDQITSDIVAEVDLIPGPL